MTITENVDVSDEILASSVLADLRSGTCNGYQVAVKAMRVTAQDDFVKIRKVSINASHPERGPNHSAPEILEGSRSLEHALASECHETCWSLWRYGERAIRHRVRVDVTRERHGVHQKQ